VRNASRKSLSGFTLLEMLLALLLGVMLLATINQHMIPLLKSSKQSMPDSLSAQAQELLDNMSLIADKGIAAFPTNLDNHVKRSSLAIQFLGTGQDMLADANQDDWPGIAHMDVSADRSSSITSTDDDDRDGVANEDEINGLDDDNDGLIDEDPGDNDDNIDKAGEPYVDDNGDDRYDDAWESNPHNVINPWSPFLPGSVISTSTADNGKSVTASFFSSTYNEAEDDNEDGITNNGPMITWTARLEDGKIICTTPLIEHRLDGTSNPADYHLFLYREYICLDSVNDFSVVRSYNKTGAAIYAVTLSIESAGKNLTLSKNLIFP